MGNLFTLCAIGGSESKRGENVLRVLKMNDGRTLEFRAPIKVKDLLINYPNSYVGIFREATQPLPLEYKLMVGKIYYLLPSFSTREDVSTSLLCSVPRAKEGGVRIKVVITKEQLRLLLSSNQTRLDTMLLGISKKLESPVAVSSTCLHKLGPIAEETE